MRALLAHPIFTSISTALDFEDAYCARLSFSAIQFFPIHEEVMFIMRFKMNVSLHSDAKYQLLQVQRI